MKVIIRNRFFTLKGGSTVKDENGVDVYKVNGKLISPTRVKWVCEMNGKKLFKVRNKFLNFFIHKAYIYDSDNRKIARVKDKLFNIHNEYFVEGYKDEIHTEGRFFSTMESKIFRNGDQIGTMRRRIDWTDAFELEAEKEDIPFLIALVIAVDNIVDKKTNTK